MENMLQEVMPSMLGLSTMNIVIIVVLLVVVVALLIVRKQQQG